MSVRGNCKINKQGILNLSNQTPFDRIPAIKRHAKNIKKGNLKEMQYGNALHLSSSFGIPLNQIII